MPSLAKCICMMWMCLQHKQTVAPAAVSDNSNDAMLNCFAKCMSICDSVCIASKPNWLVEIKVSTQQNCKWLYASVLTAIVIKVSHLFSTIKSSPFLFRTRVWSKTVFCNRPCMKNQGLAGGVLTQLFLPWIFLQKVYVRFERRISKM